LGRHLFAKFAPLVVFGAVGLEPLLQCTADGVVLMLSL